MGIYSKQVEDRIAKIPEEYNILQNYDNYTYHIQFFMLPSDVQKKVDTNLITYEQIENEISSNKIIIAESGVTPNINIQKFTINSVVPGGALLSTALTFELSFEDLSYELINKLAVVSKVLGYENHITHPYYISVWFTGYENVTSSTYNSNHYSKGLPQTNIGGRRFTYKCIIDKVKTEQHSDKMIFNMHLVWCPTRANLKDFTLIHEMPQMTIPAGQTFDGFVNYFQQSINDMWRHRLTSFEENAHSDYDEVYGATGNMYEFDIVYSSEESRQEVQSAILKDSQNFKLEPTEPFPELFLRLWQMMKGPSNYSLFVYPEMKYIKDYKQYCWYKIIVHICFYKCPGLYDVQKIMCENDRYFFDAEKNQLNYLDILFPQITNTSNGAQDSKNKVKRYYLHSYGKNINVLNCKEDDDYLWFLNIGINAKNQIFDSKLKTIFLENNPTENTKFNQTKEKFKIGKHNLDDIYMSLDNNQKELYLSIVNVGITREEYRNASEDSASNESLEKTTDTTSNPSEINSLKAKLGYNGLFGVSQRKLLELDILGDPYWLGINDEKFLSNLENVTNYVIPHIILSTKSFKPVDENYIYKANEYMVFNTPYRILQVTSYFENGKFTQKLKGAIALPFIQSTKEALVGEQLDYQRALSTISDVEKINGTNINGE